MSSDLTSSDLTSTGSTRSSSTAAADPAGPDPTGGTITVTSEPDAPAGGTTVAADGLPRRFVGNVAVNYLAVGVAALSSLLLTPFLIQRLGVAAFGVWALAFGTVGYLDLLKLGFGVATTKLVAEDAEHRPEAALRTLNTSFFLLLGPAALALVIGLIVSVLAPSLFSVPADLQSEMTGAFAILALAVAISIPCDTFGGVLSGYQRYDLLAASNLLSLVLQSLAIVGVLLAGGGLVALSVSNIIVSASMHLVRWAMVRRVMPRATLRRRLVDRSRIRTQAGLSGWFLVRDVAVMVVFKVDLVVVGIVLGVQEVALYSVGSKLAKLAEQALFPLAQVFFPHASALSRQDDREGLRGLLVDGTRTTLMIGLPITLILALLAPVAVEAWVGPGYGTSAAVLVGLAAAFGFSAVTNTGFELLGGHGQARTTATIAAGEAAVNLVASVLLARVMGPVGVALGTLVGNTVVALPSTTVLACRTAGLPIRTLVRQAVLPHLAPALGTAAALLVLRSVLTASRPLVIVAGGAAFLLYLAIYFQFSATPTERGKVRSLTSRLSVRIAS